MSIGGGLAQCSWGPAEIHGGQLVLIARNPLGMVSDTHSAAILLENHLAEIAERWFMGFRSFSDSWTEGVRDR